MLREALFSAFLHFLGIILLISGLPHLFRSKIEPAPIIPVEVVNIADVTQAPAPKAKLSPVPPQPQPEPEAKEQKPEPPKPEPKPEEPKPAPLPKDAISDLMQEIEKQPKEIQKEEKPKKETSTPKQEEKKKSKKTKKNFLSVLKNVEKIEKSSQQEGDADISPHNVQNISDILTATENDLIRRQFAECWGKQGADRNLKDLAVDIYVEINPDMTVREAKIKGSTLPLTNPSYRAFADSARRAVKSPACNPLRIPRERYAKMKTFTMTFSGQGMY